MRRVGPASRGRMSGVLSALLPQAEISLTDLFDEVKSLRMENADLKAQVSLLAEIGKNNSPESATAVAALLDPTSKVAIVAEQKRAGELHCLLACLACEISSLEQLVENTRLQGNVEREELALRCEQLGTALEQRVLLAERTQLQAVAAARRQSADAVASLEAELEALNEQMASREALADAYGHDAELAQAELRLREATAIAERERATSSRLREELERMRREHADELRLCEQRNEAAQAEAAQSQIALRARDGVVTQLQGQLARLSEGFNKQVEEVLSLQARLEKAQTGSVDKATARSWIVNFVEQGTGTHGDELLRIMADWWEVSLSLYQRIAQRFSFTILASPF